MEFKNAYKLVPDSSVWISNADADWVVQLAWFTYIEFWMSEFCSLCDGKD